ncbi:class I SAM-dependent methyltransferase [Microtetraspora malaysiensis]|uniref:class I SAM-dependent methyltransferase n=1 Tax=Microtetraspora malaysiensis TaxID=161358 RepID=UPI0008340F0C|nr:class I SAM-dependent methyltransferase [Microtetraspora malaysiensis]
MAEHGDAHGHRCFALLYDRITRGAEERWLGALRDHLVGNLSGQVLEIGAGTGANLAHYREAERVVTAEPDPAMRQRLRRRKREASVPVEISSACGEELPYPDASFDAVVSTLVLCSVVDLNRTLAEVRRVLRPTGTFVFCEHVRDAGVRGRIQDLLTPLWRRIGAGCRPNRRTLAALEQAGLVVHHIETIAPHPNLPFTVPIVHGVARPVDHPP